MNIQALLKKGINSLENNIFKNSVQSEAAQEKAHPERRAEVLTPQYRKPAVANGRRVGYRFSLPFLDGEDIKDGEYTEIHQIPVNRICPNPWQPRRTFDEDSIIELAESIKRHGLIQPVTVRRLLEDNCSLGGLFCVVSGERRLRAMKYLGWEQIPCIILNTTAEGSATLALVENIVREDLNFFDEAVAIAALSECHGLSREEIANRLSLSVSAISNKLRLLKLSETERKMILENGLSERHARALLRIANDEKRLEALNYIVQNKFTVAETDKYISSLLGEVQVADETDQITEVEESCNTSLSDQTSETEDKPKRTAVKAIKKDAKVFYKSILRAISHMEQAGIGVISQQHENDDVYEVIIRIPKKTFSDKETAANPEEMF